MGTPLNVILVQAESLLERAGDEKTKVALQSILRQVERLIPLREQLCFFDDEPGREPSVFGHNTMLDGRWAFMPDLQHERRSDPR